MKFTTLILLLFILPAPLWAQYYFTGEVRGPHDDQLPNVSILIQSSGSTYRTGTYGDFGIVSRRAEDTVTFQLEGCDPYTTAIRSSEFLQVTLRESKSADIPTNHLISLIKGIQPYVTASPPGKGAYNGLFENPFVAQSATASFPACTNGESYHTIRRFLDLGYPVPHDAVKIEEMLNYFNDYYEEPGKDDGDNTFHCSSSLLSCPWNAEHKLLFLNVCARKADMGNAPPAHLVFLIDASGSMDMPNKLPLVKSGFRLLIKNLRDIDEVSIVAFGGRTGILLEGVSGAEKAKIGRTIEDLSPDGPTPGEAGVRLAYEVARREFLPGGNNRIILITDGDIGRDASAALELDSLVNEQDRAGIHFACLGVGKESAENPQLARLARKGHGICAQVEDEQQAEKALANQLSPALFSVADSVCISIDFDSTLVKGYRLIGFDNKRSVLEDTTFHLEGASIGSGHSLMALFELVPKPDTTGQDTLAEVKIRYCLPGQNSGKRVSYTCVDKMILFEKAADYLKKAACIAILGMKLRESDYVSQISWMDLEKLAKRYFVGNNFIDKEYIDLVLQARKIYRHNITAFAP